MSTATIVLGFEKEVHKTVSKIQASQAAIKRKADKKTLREWRALERRTGMARTGLSRLIAFSRKRFWKRLLTANEKLPPEFQRQFVLLSYKWAYIGGTWNDEVEISVARNSIRLHAGGRHHHAFDVTFLLSTMRNEVRWGENKASRDAFLRTIADSHSLFAADYENDAIPAHILPHEVLFDLLVRCGRKRFFEAQIRDSLEAIAEQIPRLV